jgi:RecA-family ATPase
MINDNSAGLLTDDQRYEITELAGKLEEEGLDRKTAGKEAMREVLARRKEKKLTTSAAELLKKEFPPINWIVNKLIPHGLTLIVGAPKIGKSWLVMGLVIAAANAGRFLGIQTAKTETLYLALEDTERRLKSRLVKLNAPSLENLHFATTWDQDKAFISLDNFLKENENIKLVIIDTLGRFFPIDDTNSYTSTTNPMAQIKRIADDRGIAIVVIHHAGKKSVSKKDWLENVLGSTGLAGASDTIIYLDREREKPTGKLHATGRDFGDTNFDLLFDTNCGWSVTSYSPGYNPGGFPK